MNAFDWQVVISGATALSVVALSIAATARRAGVLAPVSIAGLAWLALTFELATRGFFQHFDALPPRVMVAAMTALVATLAWTRAPSGRRFVEQAPLAAIAAVQVFRVPVEVGLHALYARGSLPVQMTWSGRNVDVFVGLSAPLVAWGFHRAWIGRRAFALWHLASLAALVNIVATSAMSFPGPLRRFHEGVSAEIVATAPYIWLPAVLVPFAAASHVLSLRALAAGR